MVIKDKMWGPAGLLEDHRSSLDKVDQGRGHNKAELEGSVVGLCCHRRPKECFIRAFTRDSCSSSSISEGALLLIIAAL